MAVGVESHLDGGVPLGFGFMPRSIHSEAHACRSACRPYLATSRVTGPPALLTIGWPASFSIGTRSVMPARGRAPQM
jgi:hypothetical protein